MSTTIAVPVTDAHVTPGGMLVVKFSNGAIARSRRTYPWVLVECYVPGMRWTEERGWYKGTPTARIVRATSDYRKALRWERGTREFDGSFWTTVLLHRGMNGVYKVQGS